MARNGILLLRRQGGAGALSMSLATPGEKRPGPPQRIAVTVRTDQGGEVQHTATLEAEVGQFTFPVPPNSGYGLYEIEWRFDHAECERPSACFSARLLEARLVDALPGSG
jgi:hypothetical protein